MRRSFWSLSLLTLALAIVGCSGAAPQVAVNLPAPADPGVVTPTSAEPNPVPNVQPWNEVTDGTWEYGDVALGEPVETRWDDYRITITSPPTLTTEDEGATVLMSSPLSVERLSDRGTGETIADDVRVFFTPGNLDVARHSEVYGVYVQFDCDPQDVPVGETALCTVSFEANSDEIQNSYWDVAGKRAAAWPGQVPS